MINNLVDKEDKWIFLGPLSKDMSLLPYNPLAMVSIKLNQFHYPHDQHPKCKTAIEIVQEYMSCLRLITLGQDQQACQLSQFISII